MELLEAPSALDAGASWDEDAAPKEDAPASRDEDATPRLDAAVMTLVAAVEEDAATTCEEEDSGATPLEALVWALLLASEDVVVWDVAAALVDAPTLLEAGENEDAPPEVDVEDDIPPDDGWDDVAPPDDVDDEDVEDVPASGPVHAATGMARHTARES